MRAQEMKTLRHLCLITGMALVVFAGRSDAGKMADEAAASFASICADREVQVVTLIEDHARAVDPSSDALSAAGFARLQAQAACYDGRVAEAVAMYDGIITRLGPVLLCAAR
jgi:hypothetical protein